MTSRVILGIFALGCGAACGVISGFTYIEMADKANNKLPDDERFPAPGWYWSSTNDSIASTGDCTPTADFSGKARMLMAVIIAALVLGAWSIGFFEV